MIKTQITKGVIFNIVESLNDAWNLNAIDTIDFNDVMQHHACGNYFNLSDFEELDSPCIEWEIDFDKYDFIAHTEFGNFYFRYDFTFSFESNLQAFYECLIEFLVYNINK